MTDLLLLQEAETTSPNYLYYLKGSLSAYVKIHQRTRFINKFVLLLQLTLLSVTPVKIEKYNDATL